MPEARRGAARQSLHSVLYSSPAWSPEQPKPTASPAVLPPRGIFIPALHRSRARVRTHRAIEFIRRSGGTRARRAPQQKRARFGRADNEYYLAACVLAFGSVIFTASSQAIHKETK